METTCGRDNYQAAKADRLSSDNKGVELVSFSEAIRFVNRNNASLENNAMELMITVLRLPSGQCFQLTVIYRSPSVSVDTVLETITNLSRYSQIPDMVSAIMGDFNEDLLLKPDSKLAGLMSQFGYSQLIQTPTTDKATLIDHIYCNNLPPECVDICVADVDYSDHDVIFCSIPLS